MANLPFLAIIPAAGLSRRMGQPKLLLPWRGSTVIANLVGELRGAGVSQILVVMRSSDLALQSAVEAAGATPVIPPADPPDMRSSVQLGLQAARWFADQQILPTDATACQNGWLLIPADHPIVSRETIDTLHRAWNPGMRQILIPTHEGQRGHPTLFSADFAPEVTTIPPDRGLNWLVRQNSQSIREVPVSDPGVLIDLDTPEDYQALLNSVNRST